MTKINKPCSVAMADYLQVVQERLFPARKKIKDILFILKITYIQPTSLKNILICCQPTYNFRNKTVEFCTMISRFKFNNHITGRFEYFE